MTLIPKVREFARSRLGVNILGTAVARLGTVAVGLYAVRLALDILPASEYGVWLTLASILAWIHLFDVGLGHGLRNHLTVALTRGDLVAGQRLVSSAYVGLTAVAAVIGGAYLAVSPHVDWQKLLNADSPSPSTLAGAANIVALSALAQFLLKTITSILHADQRAWLASGLELAGSGLTLAGLLFLRQWGQADLVTFAIVLSAAPVVSLLGANLVLFLGRYRRIRPSFRAVSWERLRLIGDLGLKFFALQIAVLILLQATNLMIARLYAPAAVTEFQITVRYYSVVALGWSFVLAPLWSAFTEAIERRDHDWARGVVTHLYRLFGLTGAGAVVLFFLADPLIALWTRDRIHVDPWLNVSVAVYTLVSVWNNLHAYYLNGASELRLQLRTALAGVLVLPVAVVALRTYADLGAASVVVAITLALSVFGLLAPREVARHLSRISPDERPKV